MSPGMPWSHVMRVPPHRWVPELSGAVNPAWAITYSVRPEQSKPILGAAGVVLGTTRRNRFTHTVIEPFYAIQIDDTFY